MASTPQPERAPLLFHTLLGLLLGVLLFDVLGRSQATFAAENVGLGLGTVPFTAEREGRQISGPFEDLPALMQSFRELRAEGRRIALWLGASQLYAINQPRDGDRLAGWYASERAQRRGSDLAYLVCANPNANPNELYAALQAFLQHDLVPDLLLLGFTFDDLGEPGIRPQALEWLRRPDAAELETGGAGAEHLAAAFDEREGGARVAAPVQRSPTDGTPQAWLEDRLVAGLEQHWPAYRSRGSLRSAAISAWKLPLTAALYHLFRHPTIRIPTELARWNEGGLESLLTGAEQRGLPLFVYKCPYRPDPEAFLHDRRAYDDFHARLQARVQERGGHYRDLETLVPVEAWGRTSDGSPDVYHYRDSGHRLLGEALDGWLEQAGF